jgi:hypothetical protein
VTVPIPDEARVWLGRGTHYPYVVVQEHPEDGYSIVSTNGDNDWSSDLPDDVIELVPRAAVVQELRNMAVRFDDDSTGQQEFADLPGADDEGRDACLTEARVFSDVADRLRARAEELETPKAPPSTAP